MTDQARKRPKRSWVGARIDEFTLAAFAVLVLVMIVVVFSLGMETARSRIGCGLNDLVNALLPYPRPCR